MILDTVVLSIIWWVFSFDLIRPIISEGDHAPEIGSLGIRWKGQLLYAFLAIVFGILAAYFSLKFEYQLLGQGGLFGILVLTWLFSLMAKRKVSEVAAAETKALDGRAQMKIAVRGYRTRCSIAPMRRTISVVRSRRSRVSCVLSRHAPIPRLWPTSRSSSSWRTRSPSPYPMRRWRARVCALT